jgi:hypothetical protein
MPRFVDGKLGQSLFLKCFDGNSCYLINLLLKRSCTTKLDTFSRAELYNAKDQKLLQSPTSSKQPALLEYLLT